ncbi:unnamed protein product [Somion occarium]|uniref:DUF6699 domain-containing protein n=1 Tax=Somion occarium TaxID=3059160 RepID=A0ABP1EBH0_9APHY
MVRRTTIYDLPYELLFIIRDAIPESHLFTHIAFSSTCVGVHALYEDEDFWRCACLAYGLGVSSRPGSPMAGMSWRQLAGAQVIHAARCTNERDCIHFLSYESVPRELYDYIYSPGRYTCGLSLWRNRTWQDSIPLTPETLRERQLSCHGFRTVMVFDLGREGDSTRWKFYNVHAASVVWGNLETTWNQHLAIASMFATNPPLTQLKLRLFDCLIFYVENQNGVTVWDVLSKIQSILSGTMTMAEFMGIMHNCENLLPELQSFSSFRSKNMADVKRWFEFLRSRTQEIGSADFDEDLAKIDDLLARLQAVPQQALEHVSILEYLQLNVDEYGSEPFTDILQSYVIWNLLPLVAGPRYRDCLRYESISSLLPNVFFGGLRQKEPGSTTFNVIWHFPSDHNVRSLLHRLQRSNT